MQSFKSITNVFFNRISIYATVMGYIQITSQEPLILLTLCTESTRDDFSQKQLYVLDKVPKISKLTANAT